MSRRSTVPLEDRCQVARCRSDYDLVYLNKRICDKHWTELCDDKEALYDALSIGIRMRKANENEVTNVHQIDDCCCDASCSDHNSNEAT